MTKISMLTDPENRICHLVFWISFRVLGECSTQLPLAYFSQERNLESSSGMTRGLIMGLWQTFMFLSRAQETGVLWLITLILICCRITVPFVLLLLLFYLHPLIITLMYPYRPSFLLLKITVLHAHQKYNRGFSLWT